MPIRFKFRCFMRSNIKSYLSDQSGAAAAEYALILTIIGTALAGAIVLSSNDIATALKFIWPI